MTPLPPSRRDFAAAASAAALTAASYARVAGASKRLLFGVVGCGGMGTGHVSSLVKRSAADNLQVAAVCDVYQRRLTRAMKIASAKGDRDYRRLIDDKDLDCILIATPDHWHGKISIDALDAGKHVYVEKPMTHTVEQALAVRDAVRRTKMVLQVGPNATASDACWQAHDALRAGRTELARDALHRGVRLSPGLIATILSNPRLALRMATLAAAPRLAGRLFARGE